MKCHRVLKHVADGLMAGAIAAEVEDVLMSSPPQATRAVKDLLQRGGHVRMPLLRPAPHLHLLHSLSNHPTFRIISDRIMQHAAAHFDGGWRLTFLVASMAQRLMWLVHREPGWTAEAAVVTLRLLREYLLRPILAMDLCQAGSGLEVASACWQYMGLTFSLPTDGFRGKLEAFVLSRLRLDSILPTHDHCIVRAWASAIVGCMPLCAVEGGRGLAPNRVQIRCISVKARNLGNYSQSRPGMVLDRQLPLELQVLYGEAGITPSAEGPLTCLLFTETISGEDGVLLMEWMQAHPASLRCLKLVACQKTVDVATRERLARRFGIAVLERLGMTLLSSFCATTQAKPLPTVHELTLRFPPGCPDEPPVGIFRSLTASLDAGRYTAFLEGVEAVCTHHVVSLFLSAHSVVLPSVLFGLIEAQAHDALHSLCQLFSQGAKIAKGSGYFEVVVAAFLRCRLVFSSALLSSEVAATWTSGDMARLKIGTMMFSDILEQYRSTFLDGSQVTTQLSGHHWSRLLRVAGWAGKLPVQGPLRSMDVRMDELDPIRNIFTDEGDGGIEYADDEIGGVDSFWCARDATLSALEVLENIFQIEVLDVVHIGANE